MRVSKLRYFTNHVLRRLLLIRTIVIKLLLLPLFRPNPNEEQMEYDELQKIAHFLRKRTEIKPVLGIICGSGLGGMVDELDPKEVKCVIPYKEIEGFPNCSG